MRLPRGGDDHRFGQELRQDVASPRADRLADADLARPLCHRCQQDVHDPDPADEQRDRGEGAEQQLHHEDALGDLREALGPVRHDSHLVAPVGPGVDQPFEPAPCLRRLFDGRDGRR